MTLLPLALSEPNSQIWSLNLSGLNRLLFHIANLALRHGGHHYGSFLEAANTAAKLSVYFSPCV